MASSSTSSTASVSASAYLHLAPPSAQTSFTPEEVRQLVLEYLCSCCYFNSARAFAREIGSVVNEAGKNGELIIATPTDATERATLNGAVTNGRSKSNHGMDGIEATPPPSDGLREAASLLSTAVFDPDGDYAMDGEEADDEDREEDELEELEVESSLRATAGVNGKAVTFDDEIEEEDDDGEGWPMLSVQQLKEVRLRRDIRDHILSGRIQSAIDLLNDHYPSVLATFTKASPPADPRSPLTFFIPTLSSAPPLPSGSKSSVPVLGDTFSPAALSLRPEILALNLQLQSFVELIRSANSTSSNPSTPTSTSAPEDSPSDGGMSGSTSSIASSRTTSMMKAIAHSQALRAKVNGLPLGKEKEVWEKECVDVSGLMAYTDLTICPVRGYLSQSRRETLAELVNAAILQQTDHTPMPLLGLVARQTSAIWGTLAELKVTFPPTAPNSGPKERSRNKIFPRFDLHTFLSENEHIEVSENGGL